MIYGPYTLLGPDCSEAADECARAGWSVAYCSPPVFACEDRTPDLQDDDAPSSLIGAAVMVAALVSVAVAISL